MTLTTAVVTETDTLTRSSYITVSAGGCVSPTTGFSGEPLTGTAPLTVSFSDASSGTISSRWWSFGDGGSSSETNPVHSYTQTGSFTVTLTTAAVTEFSGLQVRVLCGSLAERSSSCPAGGLT